MTGIHHDHVLPGEELQVTGTVVPVAGAEGIGLSHGAAGFGKRLGSKLGRLGAVDGADSSVARGVPSTNGGRRLQLTNHRLILADPVTHEPEWTVGRTSIAGVSKSPRLQLLARFRLHFTDGSSVSFMTPRAKTVRRLQEQVGTRR